MCVCDSPHSTTRSSFTSRVLGAHDKASVQINVGDVDPATGRYTGTFRTFALSGFVREKGDADVALNTLTGIFAK